MLLLLLAPNPFRKSEDRRAGQPWFVAAKRLLADKIDSRLPAGPSEVIVLADETANPELAALDILIETEHGPDSSGFLSLGLSSLLKRFLASLPTYLAQMSPLRQDYALTVLSGTNGGIVLTKTAEQAYQFVNNYAPEHCQILSKQPDQHLDKITTASEILLGEYAAGSLANYMMGPNCVLPTSGRRAPIRRLVSGLHAHSVYWKGFS